MYLGIQITYILNPSCMLSYPAKVQLKVSSILFKILLTYCATQHADWKSLLDRVLFKQHGLLDTVASFAVQNTYFFHNWDLTTFEDHDLRRQSHDNYNYASFLDINFRTANFSQVGHSVKSFVNTRVARTVFNHYALSKFSLPLILCTSKI